MSASKPLLLLDVDGPLNPWQTTNSQRAGIYKRHRIGVYVVWLARDHGQELLKLTDVFDLVWCTTWEHQANTDIGPRIGLPKLPVIEFGDKERSDARVHWKTQRVVEYAEGRNFAWVDDEVSRYDEQYLKKHHAGKSYLQKVSPSVGMEDADFADLRQWASVRMFLETLGR